MGKYSTNEMRKLVVEDFAMEYTMILRAARLYLAAEDTQTQNSRTPAVRRVTELYTARWLKMVRYAM